VVQNGENQLPVEDSRITLLDQSGKIIQARKQSDAQGRFGFDIGMDRVWNIYADKEVNMTYTLQHNLSTNGIAYFDKDAKVVQYTGPGNWISQGVSYVQDGVHTRQDIATRTVLNMYEVFYTKLGAEIIGLTAVDDFVEVEFEKASAPFIPGANDEEGSSPILINSAVLVSYPRHGTVTVNKDGSMVYTPNPGYVGPDDFIYEISDQEGRKSQATVYIDVFPRKLEVPNVITPNGDGYNDVLMIIGREGYDRIDLTIFNRWGNEVFRSLDYKDDWAGSGLNAGTYFYIVRAFNGGRETVLKGDILIKRY